MADSGLEQLVAAEIVALHQWFEHWFAGDESADFGRAEAAFADDFVFVSPQGDVIGREALLGGLREGWGGRSLPIRVENIVVKAVGGNLALATYEEWHDHAEYSTSRQSTAVFTVDSAASADVRWVHVHETWKLPPPQRR